MWMTTFLFKEFFSFFKKSILGGISQTNQHLLILDGHGSHVSLEAIEQAHQFRLYMVTLLSHTSRALQPLDMSWFKIFKTTFRKEKDSAMSKNICKEPNKIVLVGWVEKTLDLGLSKQNIKYGFKVIGIWPINPRAMVDKILISEI